MDKKPVQAIYKLPTDVKYCKECVVSNQRPRIGFDDSGVCNACNYAKKKHNEIDWGQREKELLELLSKHRRKDGSFDVIVPSSGGKDSARVVHELKHKYNMHPLTITWSPHIYTDIGWANFQALIKAGFDNILGSPNGQAHRRMTALSFKEMGEPFQPFIYGQVSFPLQMAVKYGVPLIMDGENGEEEYGGETSTSGLKGFDLEQTLDYWFSGMPIESWHEHGFTNQDLYFYMPPSVDEVRSAGIERAFYSYYRKWVPQEHYYYAAENTGFLPNPDGRSEGTYSKYASLDDRIDGFHFYLMFIKFGIGRATSDAAHEIRDGHLTREEAVALVRRYDGEFPKKHFQEFLEYCDMSEDEFWEVVDSWRSPHLWEQSGGEWKLKTQIS